MQLLDGNACSEEIRREIKIEVEAIISSGGRPPHLAAVLVGKDGASQNYVAFKIRDCEEAGFDSTTVRMDASITEQDLLNKVSELNENAAIDGFIVQLPLPAHINESKIVLAIDPKKDVDGFCPENVGNLNLGLPTYVSATPNGIMELFKRNKITSGIRM